MMPSRLRYILRLILIDLLLNSGVLRGIQKVFFISKFLLLSLSYVLQSNENDESCIDSDKHEGEKEVDASPVTGDAKNGDCKNVKACVSEEHSSVDRDFFLRDQNNDSTHDTCYKKTCPCDASDG